MTAFGTLATKDSMVASRPKADSEIIKSHEEQFPKTE